MTDPIGEVLIIVCIFLTARWLFLFLGLGSGK